MQFGQFWTVEVQVNQTAIVLLASLLAAIQGTDQPSAFQECRVLFFILLLLACSVLSSCLEKAVVFQLPSLIPFDWAGILAKQDLHYKRGEALSTMLH